MRLCWWALVALGLTVNLTAAATQFEIVSDSAEPDPHLRQTTFELAFTTPWPILGEDDTRFSYELFALQHGELTNDLRFPPLVPLPPASATGALGLAALAVWFAKRRPRSFISAPRRGRAQDVLIRS